MTCLCSHCKDNAVAAPDDVLCADCAADVAEVVQLRPTGIRPQGHPCEHGRDWCHGVNGMHLICEDCEIDRGGYAA